MTDEASALHLYELASSLAAAKGAFITVGLLTFKEYRAGSLIVRFQPAIGRLGVWSVGNVLSVKHLDGQLQVALRAGLVGTRTRDWGHFEAIGFPRPPNSNSEP